MMSLWSGSLKRVSIHTTYTFPRVLAFELLSTAQSGRMSPVRTSWPSSGSVTSSESRRLTTITFDQVTPLSEERSSATLYPRIPWRLVIAWIRLKPLISVPPGRPPSTS
jgi:hypothetical protein